MQELNERMKIAHRFGRLKGSLEILYAYRKEGNHKTVSDILDRIQDMLTEFETEDSETPKKEGD